MPSNNGQPQQSFQVKIDFDDVNPKSYVDQSSQNLNTNPLYFIEQEDDEAQWSNDDNKEITHVDDESELNWDHDRRVVRHIEGGEEVDCKDSEEGDEILSNCKSNDREHGLLSDSEDKQTINQINKHNISNYYTANPNEVTGVVVGQEFKNVQHFIRVL